MRSFLTIVGLVGAAIGAFFFYDTYDKLANYAPQSAHVTEVKTLCYLYKKRYRKIISSREIPCPVIRTTTLTDPQHQGSEVRERTHVYYTYEIAGQKYNSQHVQKYHDNGAEISVGDTLEIHVNKTDPTKSRAK